MDVTLGGCVAKKLLPLTGDKKLPGLPYNPYRGFKNIVRLKDLRPPGCKYNGSYLSQSIISISLNPNGKATLSNCSWYLVGVGKYQRNGKRTK